MYCSICKVHYKNRSEFGTRERRKSSIVRKCKKCKEDNKKIPIKIYRSGYYDEDDYYQRAMEYVEARWEKEYDEEERYYRNDDEYGYYGDSYEI